MKLSLEKSIWKMSSADTIGPSETAGWPIVYYHMAVAYQAKGRNDEAIEQFEKFLSIREPGDENEFVRDARQRLEVLRRSS